jgi:hypothetical protein
VLTVPKGSVADKVTIALPEFELFAAEIAVTVTVPEAGILSGAI